MDNHKSTSEPLEIERKFLIRYPDRDLLDRKADKKVVMEQIYLLSEKGVSRRIRKSISDTGTKYWYNEKEKISDMTRIEREREITEEEYRNLLREKAPDTRTIHKTRYYLPSGDHCFEVDIFPEWEDRAFAEVELEYETQEFQFPECLNVVKEVTDDDRYTNLSLAIHGFVYEKI